MDIPHYETALIVGAGEGLSASLTRLFAREGMRALDELTRILDLGPVYDFQRVSTLHREEHP